MTSRADQVDLQALGAQLAALADHAIAGGASSDLVDETVAAVLCALLDSRDPRRQRSLKLARRMEAARAAGLKISEIGQEFGRSRSAVHRLLADVSRSRETVSVLTRRRVTGGIAK